MQSLFFILPGENFLPTQQAHPLDNLRHVECGNDQISLPVPTCEQEEFIHQTGVG